ncbi:MAG TPA: indolepyruvate oxidoreductase subunit beta [Firmicutes bacterium]|nr:indolepyruvate oxidoreductase subunit beta [Bacillota bacterium]
MRTLQSRFDILLAGVGGQGVVLASRVLAAAALKAGLATKTSETMGMAQREGSVTSHVRIGTQVYSPLISQGQANLLVSLEPAEAVRNLAFLHHSGWLLVNTEAVIPVTVSAGLSKYNDDKIKAYLAAYVGKDTKEERLLLIDGSKLAREAGSEKTLNSVMLGAVCGIGLLPMTQGVVLETLLHMVPPRTAEMNKKAFNLGYEEINLRLADRGGQCINTN